jgi:hypothetical protein
MERGVLLLVPLDWLGNIRVSSYLKLFAIPQADSHIFIAPNSDQKDPGTL